MPGGIADDADHRANRDHPRVEGIQQEIQVELLSAR
jgi:hypothetical protein